MPWHTVNGLDVVLLLAALAFLYLWLAERDWSRHLEQIIEDDDDIEVLEYAEQNVRVVCGVSTHWEQVQAFSGRGERSIQTIQRVNPPTEQEEICLLVHQHEGPHMGSTAVWT